MSELCGAEAVMLSQPVWDQMLESEKKKVQTLEESYAEKMRAHSVGRLWNSSLENLMSWPAT